MKEVSDYQLNEELELYKSMIKAQPQSMFLMDRNKVLIGIFNAASDTLVGFSVDDIVGNNILLYANDPTSPFHQACSMLNSAFDVVFNTGAPLKFQYMIADTYLEATITKLPGERVLSQVRNITDIVMQLKDIEQKKRNELSIALIAGGLTSWSYDVEKNTISSTHENNVIENEMTLEELLDLVIPEHRQRVVDLFNNIIEKNCERDHVTVKTKNAKGLIQWSDVHAVPHEYTSEGKVKLIIGSQKDVTKEHEYHEKLKKLNRENSLILNNTSSGFVYLTSELKVEWKNSSDVFSDSEIGELFQNGNQIKAISGKRTDYLVASILQAREDHKQIICKGKTENGIVLEVFIQPVYNDKGEFEGIAMRIDDISERERFTLELAKAKEKAEQSDKLKTAFLSNMSHEIRTPLNSIVGFTQLLPDAETEEQRDSYINIINSTTQTLLNLINDILDLSKIEAGYLTCKNENFNLSELLSELEVTFAPKMPQGVRFINDLPQKDFQVKLDRIRVSQIIVNFLTNAIKFTRSGHIKMGYAIVGSQVKIYVEDTGCGMSEEQLPRVFDRFEKFGTFEQGTGLGLSIAKAIVEVYNGDIQVESALNSGTTCWILLPINGDGEGLQEESDNKNQEEGKGKMENKKTETSGCRILVAEDNDSNYKLVEILLRGYNIKRACNGKEALELVQNEHFDLILMDVKMPLMDGMEATRLIREFNVEIPIIALTANAFEDDKRIAYEAGVNDFLTKPVNRVALAQTIEKYCKQP